MHPTSQQKPLVLNHPLENAVFEAIIRKDFSKVKTFFKYEGIRERFKGLIEKELLATITYVGHKAIILFILDHVVETKLCEKKIKFLFKRAASFGRIEVIHLLMKRFLNSEITGGKGWTYLIRNVDDIEVTRTFLELGVDPEAVNPKGRTALSLFIKADYLNSIQALLEKNVNLEAKDHNGWTALMFACFYCKRSILLLLEKGALVDAVNLNGNNALMEAISRQKWDVASLLIDAGADIDLANNQGETPLILFVKAIRFYTYADRQDELATQNFLNKLLNKKPDLEAKNNAGFNALMIALISKNVGLSEILLSHGADITAKDSKGRSILIIAIEKFSCMIGSLIEKGANIEVQDIEGRSPLMVALEKYKYKAAKMLLEKGANTEIRDKNGLTPLMRASRYGNMQTVELLLYFGADTQAKFEGEYTPLMLAAVFEQPFVYHLLQKTGL